MMIFYLFCFTFYISYSVLSFHLIYVFQLLHLFFFFLSQAFIKHSRKASVYICIISKVIKKYHLEHHEWDRIG